VAEHAARSQLMDAATQNAQRVLDELLQSIQLARQHAITREMQELAAGAGLLKRRRAVRFRRDEEQTEE
jgi:F-type H+-transporting ATPase subunit gamma